MQGGFATALGTLFTVVATTVLLIYLLLRLRRTNACRSPLPPGPWGVPLLGYLPFLRGQKHVAFKRIAEKYGPLFRVKLGAKTVAVLNNLESISEGYSKLLWRPKALFFDHSGVAGVANLNGRPWVENRRFCFRSLNSGSYGGKAIEQQVQDEVLYLAEKISEAKGEAINVADLLLPSVSNNVTSLVLGSRYDFGDDRRTLLDSLLVRLFWCLTTVSPTSVAPLGLGSITAFFFTKFVQIRSLVDNLGKFLRAEEDVIACGYLIPAGTTVMSNIWATHMDPNLWEEPEKFNPGRFLSHGISALIEKPEYLMPFSIGKRMCPAELMSTLQVFIYIATIVQRFAILSQEGKAVDLDFDSDGICVPRPQKLRFVDR